MPYAYNNEVEIFYETFGDKKNEAVVLLTGALLDYTVWEKQINFLKDDCYIIAVDNRGCGGSSMPEYRYTIDMLCEDVEIVINKEGIRLINLFGFSMGGLIAQRFAYKNREKIKRLVLSNCSLGVGNKDIILPKQDVANMYLFCGALSEHDLVQNVMDFCFGRDFKDKDPGFYEKYYNHVLPFVKAVDYQISAILDKTPLIADYDKLNMPVLIFLGENDHVTPVENKDVFLKYFPHAVVKILPGYHLTPFLQSDKVNVIIEDFLKNN